MAHLAEARYRPANMLFNAIHQPVVNGFAVRHDRPNVHIYYAAAIFSMGNGVSVIVLKEKGSVNLFTFISPKYCTRGVAAHLCKAPAVFART